ncbi:SMI1/KNR4 family protein [Undibacterium sp. Ji49W]|uniref:SMI1/KNR4 family protein n=1 Tax=Undibacterium sp. Ji49W TaxID=3413040 RepID=UPI003BF4517E
MLDAIVTQGKIKQESLIACSLQEIKAIEKHFSSQLPQTYKDFLVIAGKGAGKLFRGTDIFYPRILQLQSEARNLLAELDLTNLLPTEAKVFCMHQGYEINYFLPFSADPPVFQFFEGGNAVTMPWQSFSEFVVDTINSHLKQWPDLD